MKFWDSKTLVIAFLCGLLSADLFVIAQTPSNITRGDLMEAAALAGILANNTHDPLGQAGWFTGFRSARDYVYEARRYRSEGSK